HQRDAARVRHLAIVIHLRLDALVGGLDFGAAGVGRQVEDGVERVLAAVAHFTVTRSDESSTMRPSRAIRQPSPARAGSPAVDGVAQSEPTRITVTNSALSERDVVANVPCHSLAAWPPEGGGSKRSACVNATSGPATISTHICAGPSRSSTLRGAT